jgi:hypothetical protein
MIEIIPLLIALAIIWLGVRKYKSNQTDDDDQE